MKGQLSDHPLAELIDEISDARLSGALRLARERVQGAVYFESGVVVAALTNLRAYKLTEILRRVNPKLAARLDEAVKGGATDDGAVAALVSDGAMPEAELRNLRDYQTTHVLRALLRWTEGEWHFNPRVRLANDAHSRPNTPQLLLEFAREADARCISARLGDPGETLSLNAENAALMERLQLDPSEAFILSRLSAPITLSELLMVGGLPEDDTRRAAYALALAGLVRRSAPSRAFSPEMVRNARAQTAPAATAHAAETERKPEEAPRTAEAATAAETETVDDVRAAMEELFERARASSHYQVLGVAQSAKPGEIKLAYYALARRLHPDRLRHEADEALRQQVDIAFAKITEAYDVLKDSTARASYDLKLAAQRSQTGAASRAGSETASADERARQQASPSLSRETAQLSRAEEKFQQGLAALQKENHKLARQLLGEAALLAPNQARFRAFYGRALAHDSNARRQAESEIQTAIALDARNPSYRVMLAELYDAHGLRRRAESELEQAIAIDPSHASARNMLERLRGARTA